MRLGRFVLAIAAVAAPLPLLVGAASADDSTAPAPSASASPSGADASAVRHDPDNKTGIAEWMEKCVDGNAKVLAHDVPGAIDSYREAIQLAPKRPLPHYLLGEAQLIQQNFPEATASLKIAEQASDDRDPELRAKILFVTADMWEREKKWDEAKAAWATYSEYAAKHGDAGVAPSTPTARIQAIDDMLKQDKAYEVVRQRILDELRDAGAPAKK